MKEDINIRTFKEEDIPFAMKLKGLSKWNQVEDDWRGYLLFEPEGCFIAELDDKPVGTVTCTTYGERFAWVGMVMVHPEKRRKGIGTALINKAISYLQERGVKAIKLDATPMGKKVYVPLGFVDEYSLQRYEGSIETVKGSLQEDSLQIDPITEDNIDEIIAFDEEYFGAHRGKVLRQFRKRHPEYALCIKDTNGVLGYAMARKGYHAYQIGPLVTEDAQVAETLFKTLINRMPRGKVFTDIPLSCVFASQIVEKYSFTVQRGFDRMYLGENQYPSRAEGIFAIAAAEIG